MNQSPRGSRENSYSSALRDMFPSKKGSKAPGETPSSLKAQRVLTLLRKQKVVTERELEARFGNVDGIVKGLLRSNRLRRRVVQDQTVFQYLG